MNANKKTTELEDLKINVRIVLAALWITHFLLWTFGDMASLLQNFSEPVENNLLLLVAVPLHLIQAFMIFFSLKGKAKIVRTINLIIAFVFIIFNIGFFVDAHTGWEYLLGVGYLLSNVLVVWQASKWPRKKH